MNDFEVIIEIMNRRPQAWGS